MEGVELYSIKLGFSPCIGCILSHSCYNNSMTSNHYDQLKFVRTRNRMIEDDRFLFQTVWNFSDDGINEEVYIVSAVVSVTNERLCETYVFPALDANGNDFSGNEVFTSSDFKGHHHDHKLLLGEYLQKCAREQRNESRKCGVSLEHFFNTLRKPLDH